MKITRLYLAWVETRPEDAPSPGRREAYVEGYRESEAQLTAQLEAARAELDDLRRHQRGALERVREFYGETREGAEQAGSPQRSATPDP